MTEKERERRKKYDKKYNSSPKGKKTLKKAKKKYKDKIYNKARMIVGKGEIKCSNCGCNDKRVVEINHIDGGGNREKKRRRGDVFHGDIIKKKRKTDDLNLLCKVCNWAYYLELKYGKLPYDIKWRIK